MVVVVVVEMAMWCDTAYTSSKTEREQQRTAISSRHITRKNQGSRKK
jgi:hypothetical protein